MKGLGVVIGLLIFVGILVFLVFFNNPRNLDGAISRLEPQLLGRRCAIYLIRDASICCHVCPRYLKLKQDGINIVFIFHPDYSQNDIDNFRFAFSVPDSTSTEIMNPGWDKIYRRMARKGDAYQFSYLIVFDRESKVEGIWRF